MTEREDGSSGSGDEVILDKGRFTGCRGRVLIALLAVAVLIILLLVMLVRGMFSGTPPQPVSRAGADSITCDVACGNMAGNQLAA